VRVIAGTLRGATIFAPPGRATRPTSDRVREALFDLLGPVAPGARVLDLYAGSGALGIEALSRGAAHATFVEIGRRARQALQRNLEKLRLTGRSRVLAVDAASPVALRDGPFDLVLADPPYGAGVLADLPGRVAAALAPGGVLALEHAATDPPPDPPETLALWKSRRYGGTMVTLYVRDPEETE